MHNNQQTNAEPLLQMIDVSCGYGLAQVIYDVGLEIERGEVVCLIGPNGAGKSTLIKSLLGLIPLRKGEIIFGGNNITRISTPNRIKLGVALVPEGRGVLPGMSVEDNLFMGGYVRRRNRVLGDKVGELFELFPILAQRRKQMAGTLSGGEQQMLVIARALMSNPTLLVLDEPSLGLAPKMIDSIFAAIQHLQHTGLTILLVEQNANVALQVSQRGYVIESGVCVLNDSAAQLRQSSLVKDIYLGAG